MVLRSAPARLLAAVPLAALACLTVACGAPTTDASAGRQPLPPLAPVAAGELRAPDAFTGIADPAARSRALFVEATRVMFHPRCVNCHPDGDVPIQGDRGQLHDPPVFRGPDDHGIAGLMCTSCHQDRNLELARVPGAPKWHLAPRSMAWVGRTPHSLCEQLKDPKRNGGKTVAQIVDHAAHDPLVAWGWAPGHARTPAPGNQATYGALMAAWADNGAACPEEEASR